MGRATLPQERRHSRDARKIDVLNLPRHLGNLPPTRVPKIESVARSARRASTLQITQVSITLF